MNPAKGLVSVINRARFEWEGYHSPMQINIQRHPITCQFESKTYTGTYWVAGKILTVATGKGSKSRQVGAIPQEVLAKELLGFLAQEGKAYLDSPRLPAP